MSDMIDRQAAIDAIEFGITYAKAINKETGEVKELFQASNDELRKAEDRIKQLPSAQPERKTGKWIGVTPMVDTLMCSECEYNIINKEFKTPYCPNCGARMEVDDE